MAAFGGGVGKSLESWFPGPGIGLEKAYAECPGDLVDQDCWERWEDGVKATGLLDWINLAAGKP